MSSRPVIRDWWVSADGIDRDVISGEIQRFLGAEATAIPRTDSDGNHGYMVRAFRGLTPSMVEDLQRMTAIHRSRQRRGPPPAQQPNHSMRPNPGRDSNSLEREPEYIDQRRRDPGYGDPRRDPRGERIPDQYSQSYQDREQRRRPDDRFNDRNVLPQGQRPLPYEDPRYDPRVEQPRRAPYNEGPPQQPYGTGPPYSQGGARPPRDPYVGQPGYPPGAGAPVRQGQLDQYGNPVYGQPPQGPGRGGDYPGGYPPGYDGNDGARFYPTPALTNPLPHPSGSSPFQSGHPQPGPPQYDQYGGQPGANVFPPGQLPPGRNGQGQRPPPGPPTEPEARRRRMG